MPPAEERTGFVGRVQEQRQFLVALQGLLAHHRRWVELVNRLGPEFDFARAPGDDSYANIFLPHGIGGIGKSWLTRRCLALAQGIPNEPPLLTLYDDVSLGAPVLEPAHLLDRLAQHLEQAGYEMVVSAYRQAQADTPAIVGRVLRYQFENREQWDKLVSLAAELTAARQPEIGYQPFDEMSLAYTHASGAETAGRDAPTLAKAYDLLLEQMQRAGKLDADEAALFRNPPAAQAAHLVTAFKQVALQQPLVIGLDNLEIITPLEPLIRDCLVLPTNQSPVIWLLSGRYNLADERLVEINGVAHVYKGYRDLLGENPPVVWDMSIFGDADLRDYLEAEADRRRATLRIDDDLIEAIKATSSGVPLVVEMVTDALFTMDRDEFLREFALDDRALLPGDRLAKIAERFLRYCLTNPEDLERVQAMALLRKGIDEAALTAVWRLPANRSVADALYSLRVRYAFILPEGLHDAVYDFVRRQLRTTRPATDARQRLSRRAVDHFRAQWDSFGDSTLRLRDPRWQRATRDLLNALLWLDPDQAVIFLLPRFVEGLGFDRAFANGLLLQAEEFLTDSVNTFSDSYAGLLQRMRIGLRDIDWTFDEPGEAIGAMLDSLLDAPGLSPLHLSILHLWQGNWRVENGQLDTALESYRQADEYLPADAAGLRQQLGKAYFEISSRLLWPQTAARAVSSEPGWQAAQRAVELDPANGGAWFNLGVALNQLGRPAEAVPALEQAVKIEPRPVTLNHLGDVYRQLNRIDEAVSAYEQAIALDAAYAWPYHNLGLIRAGQGDFAAALGYYQQAIEVHQHDRDRAVSWHHFGDAHAALGNADEAISAYRWAGVLAPTYAAPWYGLGSVYSDQNRAREAIDALQKAITLDPDHAWAHHKLGQVYADQGDFAAALPYFQKAVERHTDDQSRATTWDSLGTAYAELGRPHDAIEAFRRAIKLDPANADAWNNLGDVYASLNNSEAAINAYRQAVQLDPDFAAPWNSLGNLYLDQQRDDEASEAFGRVIALEPDYAWPYHYLGDIHARRGEFEAARDYYEQAIDRHEADRDKAVTWSSLGDAQVALGQSDAAIKAYRWATTLAPDYAWPHHHLARVYQQRGDNELAIGLYQQAIPRHTRPADRAESWLALANLYQRLGRHADAVRAYRETVDLNDGNARAWNSLGDSLLAQGQRDEAEPAFRRARDLAPDFASPYHSLGVIARHNGNHAVAQQYFRQAIQRHTDDRPRAESWNLLGDTFLALAEPEDARRAYEQAVKLAPDMPQPYHSLGQLAEERGQPEQALGLYRQAAERYPDDPAAYPAQSRLWQGLGNVYTALQRPAEAVTAYRRAIDFDASRPEPWHNLGDVYRQTGQLPEAIEAYKQAIDLNPAPAAPYHNLGLVYETQGDTSQAVIYFREALAHHRLEAVQPRAQTWTHLGNAYRAQAKFDAALDAYQQAIALDAAYYEPWPNLGDLYAQLDRPEPAIEAYQRAIELNPAADRPWLGLGDVYRSQRNYPAATNACQQAILLNPTAPDAYAHLGWINEQQNNFAAAEEYYRQAIDRYRPAQNAAQARAWTGLGNIYADQDQTEAAISAYQRAAKLDATLPEPVHSLGLIHAELGQPAAAIGFYRQAIERYGDAPERRADLAEAWNDLGEAYTAAQQLDEAAAAYRRAIELDDSLAMPWFNLGNVHTNWENYADAADAYRRAISRDPDHAWAYNNLALVVDRQGDHQQAIDLYRQAIERHANPVEMATSWNNLGDVLQDQRRYDAAADAYRRAIELNPRLARPWKSLADVVRAQGRSEGVVEAYQQAIVLEPDYAWPYHSLGLICKQRRAYPQAIHYYQQAIARHQNDHDRAVSWNGLGNVYLATNQYAPAVEAYQKAIQLDPTDAWPYHNLGFVQKQVGQYQRAIGLYLQAIDRFKDKRSAAISWNNLGNVYSLLGRQPDAVEAYQTAIDLRPDYALPWNSLGEIYLEQQQPAEAIKAFEAAIQREPGYVLAWKNLGDACWQQRQFDETIRAYDKAIELDPRYAWPYHHLGQVYDERGDYELALKYYEEAIARHVNREHQAVLAEKMGDLYRIMAETGQAIEAYRRASGFDPAYASPWYSLGNVYAGQDQDEEAILAYRRAIELKPADPWPYHNLAVVYEKREVYGEAIALYRQAIERHRTDRERAVSWDSLGNVYSDLGRLEESVQAFRESIRLNAEYALPWNSLGDVYHQLGDYEHAAEAYQKAIALDPDYVWAYNSLGMVYESMGQPQQAIGVYRQIIGRGSNSPDLAVTWNNLGDIYSDMQREADAIAAYEEAIRLDPDYTWAYNRLGALYERRGDRDQAAALYQQATRRHRLRT